MKTNLVSLFMRPQLLARIANRIRSYFLIDQWTILTAANSQQHSPSWADFTPIIPPPDRFWADPFVLIRDGHYFIFAEEELWSANRGHIICLELDPQLKVLSTQVALDRPYHLSYPFLFEFEGQLYMLPETKENHAIETYRCVHFPDQWELESTLISDVSAVDATLLEHQGRWWLFANVEEEAGSSWDTLYLFYANHPLSNQWTPHPMNPIVRDVHSARPAGHIFTQQGNLIRPSQDCSVRYGYAINFNRITTLTETDYAETRERMFKPPKGGKIRATHTWNTTNGLVVIDAIIPRRKTFTRTEH